jgi:DNA polymerase-4
MHLNVADFAVAVERLSEPGLHDRPVIVAPFGAARALVYDMSEEAFQSGIRKHMALERARRLCRDARLVPPRPHRYEKAMTELLRLVRPFSPLIETEEDTGHIFMDLTGTRRLHGPPQDVAWRIRKESRQRLGLDPIWGLAANKLVAKAATRVVKPLGEYLVPCGGEERFLRPLPLHLLPGLERDDLLLLREYNLERVEQALSWRAEHLSTIFGRRGLGIHGLLRGKDDSPVLPVDSRPPVVRLDHEFEGDTNEVPEVERALHGLAERAGTRLRAQGRAARRVALVLDYSDGGRITRQRSHPQGTANDFLIFDLSRAALASAWTRRVRLRHLRLVCDRLVFPPAQMELPLTPDAAQARRRKEDSLVSALDRIRQRHGAGLVRLGRSLAA